MKLCLRLRSQSVDEFRVLSVRQIKPLLIFQVYVAGRSTDLSLLFVLADAVEVDECEDTQTYTPAYDDSHFSGDVTWCISWAECLWTCIAFVRVSYQQNTAQLTNDVANTVPNQVHGGDSGLFSVACNIGAQKT